MFEESDSPKLPFDQCLPRERSPFSPLGEKVADRPDERLCGSVLEQSTKPECRKDFKHEWRGLSVAELAKSSGFPAKSQEVYATSATNFP